MGQYHEVYNLDKEQRIHGHRIDNGLKLMEQVGFDESTSSAVWLLLAVSNGKGGGDAIPHPLIGSWGGDRIIVVGDYFEDDDYPSLDVDGLESFKDISSDVLGMLNTVFSDG